jgi:hypothetical protein
MAEVGNALFGKAAQRMFLRAKENIIYDLGHCHFAPMLLRGCNPQSMIRPTERALLIRKMTHDNTHPLAAGGNNKFAFVRFCILTSLSLYSTFKIVIGI